MLKIVLHSFGNIYADFMQIYQQKHFLMLFTWLFFFFLTVGQSTSLYFKKIPHRYPKM